MTYLKPINELGLLVILGAGASYDALKGFEAFAPPLTDRLVQPGELTDKLAKKYEHSQRIINYLRKVVSANAVNQMSLEEALEQYFLREGITPSSYDDMLAFRFYLHDLICHTAKRIISSNNGKNNYTELVDECYQWSKRESRPVCFITFNYDNLLENACRSVFGFDPLNIEQYIHDEHFVIFKPHGSILWDRVDNPEFEAIRGKLITSDPLQPRHRIPSKIVVTAQHIGCANFSSVMSIHELKKLPIPNIALPVEIDKRLAWPDLHAEYFRSRYSGDIFGKVLTIGWRGSEPHFLPLLRPLVASTSQVQVISKGDASDSEMILQTIQEIFGPEAEVSNFNEGFSHFLENKDLEQFLAR